MGLPIGDDLLRNGDVRVGREETTRAVQEALWDSHRRDEHPIGPSLRDHRVRLHTIQDFFPLQRGLLYLIRCDSTAQSLIGRFEFFLQLFIFLFQFRQLNTGVLIFPKRGNRSRHLVRIHLCQKVSFDDHDISVERGGNLLIEHDHQSRRVSTDFIFGHIHVTDDGDAFEIGRDLFECIPFGRLDGQSDRILLRIAIAHAMLTLSVDDPDVSERRGSGETHCERKKQHKRSIRWIRQEGYGKRRLIE